MGEAKTVRNTARVALLGAVVLVLTTLAVVSFGASSAGAKPCDPYVKPCPPPTVQPTIIRTDPGQPGEEDRVIPERQPRTLPFTGADLTLFAATGVAAIGTGGILLRASRRRKGRS